MRTLAVVAPSFSRAIYQHSQPTRDAAFCIICFAALALLFAPSAAAGFDQCSEHSCETVLNEAQGMILADGADAIALAELVSVTLSASNFSCCRRFPPISVRASLVSFFRTIDSINITA